MRRTGIDGGFLLCWGLNLFLNWEGGALALALWIASEWFGLSWYPAAVVLGLWIFGTLLITAGLSWAGSDPGALKKNEELPNINPYSQRNNTL